MPMLLKRFSIVPELSSAARIPFPGATKARAVRSISLTFVRMTILSSNPQTRRDDVEVSEAALPADFGLRLGREWCAEVAFASGARNRHDHLAFVLRSLRNLDGGDHIRAGRNADEQS